MRQLIIVGLTLFVLYTSAPAEAVLSETFETYADGSSLAGQGGWRALSNPAVSGPILVGGGSSPSGLSGKVATGFISPGTAEQCSAILPLSGGFQNDHVYTLTFDAYARGTSLPTHNAFVGISNDDIPQTAVVSWSASHFDAGHPGPAKWVFGSNNGVQEFAGHFDAPVQFQIVLDPSHNELFGRADFDFNGSFEVETTHELLTPAIFQSLVGLEIYQDWRSPESHVGAEFDNLSLAAQLVPEPSTSLMLGLMAGTRLVWRRKRTPVDRLAKKNASLVARQ